MNIGELKDKRAKLLSDAREIHEKATDEDRDLTADEREAWDRAMADCDKIEDQIKRAERMKSADDFDREEIEQRAEMQGKPPDEIREERLDKDRVFDKWIRFGMNGMTDEERGVFQQHQAEIRAQSVGTDSEGGYLSPEGFSNEVEKSLLAFGGMREVARVIRTATGNVLPWPTYDDTGNSGSILAENTADGEQDITFAEKQLDAYKYTSDIVKVSLELMQDSFFDVQALLADALGERIGRATNAHFTTGTGTSQPNGAVTASGAGVTFSGNSAFTADALIELQHSVDPAYRGPNMRWMFHDSSLRRIRQLKDSNNQYLLAPGLREGAPDMLLGTPYTVNQSMPEVGALAKAVLIGDFSKYIIRDVRGVTLVRLDERYADAFQVAFVAFSRHDGELLDAGTDPLKHGVFESA